MTETTLTNSLSDHDLIKAACQGNLDAFDQLMQRYWSLALALALSRLNNTSEAEDVAQESFIKVYDKLGILRNPSRFVGWLSRFVLQKCVDIHRR